MSDQNPELAELKAKLTAIEAENASLKATAEAATAALNEQKRAATHAEHAAFADSLVKAGKLTPAALSVMVTGALASTAPSAAAPLMPAALLTPPSKLLDWVTP